MRCCTIPNSISRICCKCWGRKVLNTTTLSIRLMNSGANLRRAASIAVRLIFSSRFSSMTLGLGTKPNPPSTDSELPA